MRSITKTRELIDVEEAATSLSPSFYIPTKLTPALCPLYPFGLIDGKKGRFRETLLGNQVDYLRRSVIVVGPSLYTMVCFHKSDLHLYL